MPTPRKAIQNFVKKDTEAAIPTDSGSGGYAEYARSIASLDEDQTSGSSDDTIDQNEISNQSERRDGDVIDAGIALTNREIEDGLSERERRLDQKARESKDRRSQLLKAVKASAPEINKPLVDTFEKLSLENHKFAQKELVRLFQNDAQLLPATDFFDLNLAEREDLLDRIGFYKGIVIDHSLSNPVETGFKEVLRRESKKDEEAESSEIIPTKAARLLYRKPNFSGYFENYYTTSETLHQVQKNGVTDIKSSLTVAGGKATTVGVGVAGAYYDADGSNSGGVTKMLYVTANFFLPKVELSFDSSVPCASQEFEDACQQALAQDQEKEQFREIIKVLGSFGQFVSTQTLVGGRLFATDAKEFDGSESESQMTNRYAGMLKISADSVTASVESETSIEKSKQVDKRDKTQVETQKYTVHAVGGEGAVIEQVGRWAESLYDYKRWSAVQRERLIPSIELLSAGTRASVTKVLKEFATKHTALHLLSEYKAYFLFYGAYRELVGNLTKSDIVVLTAAEGQKCLSVRGDTPQNGELTARPFEWVRQVLWRITPNGNIVSYIPVTSGFPGRRKAVEYALTAIGELSKDPAKPTETIKVILSELTSDRNQVWEFTGGGELRNTAYGAKYALSLPASDSPVLKLRNNSTNNTIVWQAKEVTPEDIGKMSLRRTYGQLRHQSGLVLSIEDCEDADSTLTMADRRRVTLQRDIGGKNQLWHRKSDGSLVSAISLVGGSSDTSSDIYLVHSPENQNQLVAQAIGLKAITYKCDEKGSVFATEGEKSYRLVSNTKNGESGQIVTSGTGADRTIIFDKANETDTPVAYSVCSPKGNAQNVFRIETVDKRELIVDGFLTGVEFLIEERGQKRPWASGEYFRLRMRISASRKNSPHPQYSEYKDEPDKVDEDRDELSEKNDRQVHVDERFLILPDGPIYSLCLCTHDDRKAPRRLAFSYREKKDGPLIGLSNSNDKMTKLKLDYLGTYTGFDDAQRNGNRVIAIGLDYDDRMQRIRPKFIRRLI